MAKKIPISVNEDYEKQIKAVASMISLNTTHYGWLPKTLKYAILYTLHRHKEEEKHIPDLPLPILDIFLLSIKYLKTRKYQAEKLKNAEKSAKKYNQPSEEKAVGITK